VKLLQSSRCCVTVIVAAGAASCAPSSHEQVNADNPYPSAQAEVQGPDTTLRAGPVPDDMARHWVQDAQLRGLMKDLSAKTQQNWPKDLPQDPEDQQSRRSRDTMGAAKLADGLAAGAERIPASVTTATMSEADRAGFQAEADTLRDQALRLGQAARTNQVEHMQESLDGISATCISCHSRYRDFSGQLITQQ
jgi:hypothetical protein